MSQSKIKNKIIILDCEATCEIGTKFPNENTEIIQIGISLYDLKTKEITKEDPIFVLPENNKILSEYCISLTGITQEILEKKGISLKNANDILIEKYKSQKRIIATYGSDVIWYRKECERKNLNYPFWLEKSFDIHNLLKIKLGLTKNIGLNKALILVGLSFEGNQHDASWDAYNTARLLSKLCN